MSGIIAAILAVLDRGFINMAIIKRVKGSISNICGVLTQALNKAVNKVW